MSGHLKSLMQLPGLDSSMQSIAEKIENQIRITPEEGLMLFEKGSLATLISTAISILNQPMFAFSPVSFALIHDCILKEKKVGN
jgi:hypothetical protein